MVGAPGWTAAYGLFRSGVLEVYGQCPYTSARDLAPPNQPFALLTPLVRIHPEAIKKNLALPNSFLLVPRAGLEPATLGLEVLCSIHLSYQGRHQSGTFGAGAESRTPITSLENWDNNRYTTPATEVIITQLSCKSYISCSTVMRAPRLFRRAARSS